MTNNISISTASAKNHPEEILLGETARLNGSMFDYFSEKIIFDHNLTRRTVSFQANKKCRFYRWYKYKEAFSANLVEYLLSCYPVKKGKILDPFAGSGTSLFACSSLGYDAEGIELLPIAQKIIEANVTARSPDSRRIIPVLDRWLAEKPWDAIGERRKINTLKITEGAYSDETQRKIERYLYEAEKEEYKAEDILLFSLLCILESASYTRKDGQYLRWDHRASRMEGKSSFDKGEVVSFDKAICSKLFEIRNDTEFSEQLGTLFSFAQKKREDGRIHLFKGSCLDVLPSLEKNSYAAVITSPPYCNRYDYTRTYALELALLGITAEQLAQLRQDMLSCTVENKEKELLSLNKEWSKAVKICDDNMLLQGILAYFDYKKNNKELNNSGIFRMVRGYFYEIACIIQEAHRVLERDGMLFMVNDNVRYAGLAIPVDLILSSMAEQFGFYVENILVLPQGKGNSSQQMGKYGRDVLRKCVYVWKKR